MRFGRNLGGPGDIEVRLRRDGLLFNRRDLILWSGWHGDLTRAAVRDCSDLGFRTLDLEVRRMCGDGSSYSHYRIPLTDEKARESQGAMGRQAQLPCGI